MIAPLFKPTIGSSFIDIAKKFQVDTNTFLKQSQLQAMGFDKPISELSFFQRLATFARNPVNSPEATALVTQLKGDDKIDDIALNAIEQKALAEKKMSVAGPENMAETSAPVAEQNTLSNAINEVQNHICLTPITLYAIVAIILFLTLFLLLKRLTTC